MNAADAAEDYRTTLQELKANNKNTINLLTILADDYSEVGPAIVEAIDGHLHKVAQDQKLPVMYLTDSIVKNVADPYKNLFEKNIVKMFLHCFKNGNERVRAALHRLRLTWTDIFARGKLYELDMKVNQEDPNWPINTPVPNGGATRGIGPRPCAPVTATAAAPAAPSVAPSRPSTTSTQKVHVNPKFMDKMAAKNGDSPSTSSPSSSRTVTVGKANEVKVEVKPILKKAVAVSARDPRSVKDPRGGKDKEKEKEKKDENKKIKTEPIDEPMPSDPAPPISTKKNVKVEPAEIPIHKDEKKEERRKRSGEERKDKRREGSDRSPPPKSSRRSPPRHVNQRQQRAVGGSASSHVPPVISRPHLPPPVSAVAPPPPTNVVGSHAFSMAPRSSPPIPTGGNKPPSLMTFPPVSTPSSLPSLPPHHPINTQFVSGPGPIPGLLNPVFASANPFGPTRMGPPAPLAPLPPPMGAAPFMPPPNMSRPIPNGGPPERKHVFKDDNRLEGIPANNRIFVDGKAYEVLYIAQTAVIEKDGLPHKIYFQGEARNVVIDGVAYMLGFGETRQVVIDGDVHNIRFGAPSRELYMGDYPFKGGFGGAPIIATINGRRHEIRLSGPAPEVKIEPEPSYELSRFLVQARIDSQQQMQPRPAVPPPVAAPPTVKVEPKTDLNTLLNKLKTSGIMNMLGTNKEGSRRNDSSPPVPVASDIRGGSDRAPAPLPLFEKEPFDMRLLKTRYDSVVSALLAKRSVCEQCGLRFDSTSGKRYEKHVDWHIRKNLAATKTKETKSRGWYCSVEDWVNARDTAEDEDNGQGVDTLAKAAATAAANARIEEAEKKASMNSDEADSKTCAVCGEDFEEYFDEDSDKWKLRDCVKMGGQMCHENCVPDLSHMEEPAVSMEADIKSEEEDEKPVVSKMSIPVDPRLKSSPMA